MAINHVLYTLYPVGVPWEGLLLLRKSKAPQYPLLILKGDKKDGVKSFSLRQSGRALRSWPDVKLTQHTHINVVFAMT